MHIGLPCKTMLSVMLAGRPTTNSMRMLNLVPLHATLERPEGKRRERSSNRRCRSSSPRFRSSSPRFRSSSLRFRSSSLRYPLRRRRNRRTSHRCPRRPYRPPSHRYRRSCRPSRPVVCPRLPALRRSRPSGSARIPKLLPGPWYRTRRRTPPRRRGAPPDRWMSHEGQYAHFFGSRHPGTAVRFRAGSWRRKNLRLGSGARVA